MQSLDGAKNKKLACKVKSESGKWKKNFMSEECYKAGLIVCSWEVYSCMLVFLKCAKHLEKQMYIDWRAARENKDKNLDSQIRMLIVFWQGARLYGRQIEYTPRTQLNPLCAWRNSSVGNGFVLQKRLLLAIITEMSHAC